MVSYKVKMFLAELKRRKEGIIIGAITGAVLAYYALSQGADLNTIVAAGEGLLDGVFGRNATAIQVAQYKIYGVFILAGALIGYYLDIIYDNLGLPSKRRSARLRKMKSRRRRR